jgi:methylthioribose-1-phosphate isomerase
VDLACPDGDAIPIERRGENEVLSFAGVRVAPEGARADNPAFDVTPARLVAAIFTERGEASPPSERTLVELER